MLPALVLGVCLSLGALAGLAQENAEPAGATEPDTAQNSGRRAERDKPMLVSAAEIHANETGDGIWEIVGNVEMKQGDTTMYADHCVWNRNNNTAVLTGNVRIVDPTNEITSNRCDMNFDEETATLTENVKIVSEDKDKPADLDPKSDSAKYEYGVWTTTCDRIFYDYGEDKGYAQGNVKTVSQDGEYTLLAEVVNYEIDENDAEIITFPNNPRVVTPHNEQWVSEKAVITMPAEGRSRVVFYNSNAQIDPNADRDGGADAAPPEGEPTPEGPTPDAAPPEGEPGFEGMEEPGAGDGGGAQPPPPDGAEPPAE